MLRLNVYDEETDLYDLNKSQIIVKVFNDDGKFRDDQLWPKLLMKKCKLDESSR